MCGCLGADYRYVAQKERNSLQVNTGALGDARHMLLECPALPDLRQQFSALMSECSGVMARLVRAEDQPLVRTQVHLSLPW